MRSSSFTQLVIACVAAWFVMLPSFAFAAGSVTLGDSQPKEDDGKWKLKMTMTYGGTPPTAHIPMNFSFTPTMLYERSLTDKSPTTPVITRMPLANQEPIVKSLDVGFSDASGKLFTTTKFEFIIRRDHGFEAGEYNLVITRGNDGAQMGQQIRIVLQGDNPVVDRRAIVFSGEKKPKKTEDPAAADKKEETPSNEPAATEPTDPAAMSDGVPTETPPSVEPKKGGCGCRLEASSENNGFGALALAGFFLLALRRRRDGAKKTA